VIKLKAMLASRIFWAAAVGLLMVVARAAMPTFPLENEALSQVLYVIGAYIFGEAVEGGGPSSGGWRTVIKSRKFWASILGAGFVFLHTYFPNLALDETQVEQLVWVFVTFIAGTGISDRMQADDRAVSLSQPQPPARFAAPKGEE
jgi:uncharacterized membrane protein